MGWKEPFISNSFNPEFLHVVSIAISGIGLLGFLQLNAATTKPFTAPKSTPTLWLRLALVSITGLSSLILWNITSQFSLLSHAIAILLVFLPLQALEVGVSPVAHASVLYYWYLNTLFTCVVVAQDTFSEQKVYGITPQAFALEVVYLVAGAATLVSELYTYEPLEAPDDVYLINAFSRITFSWTYPLVKKIYQTGDIEQHELLGFGSSLSVETSYRKLIRSWQSQVSRKSCFRGIPLLNRLLCIRHPTPNLLLAVIVANSTYQWLSLFFELGAAAAGFFQPFLLLKMLVFIGGKNDKPLLYGVVLSFAMFVNSIVEAAFFNQATDISNKGMVCSDSSLTYFVYSKALKLSPAARKTKSTGEIVSLVTVDVDIIRIFLKYFHDCVADPIRLVIGLVSLYKLMGTASLGGLAAGALLIPFIYHVTVATSTLYELYTNARDMRTSFTNEILNSIKSVKLHSWEKPMSTRLFSLRDKELDSLRKLGICNSFSTFLWSCVPFFISAASYACFTWIYDVPLTPEIIFPSLTLFELITVPVLEMPNTITSTVEALGSAKRLARFLLLEEIDYTQGGLAKRFDEAVQLDETAVKITNATFLWSKNDDQFKDDDDLSTFSENSNDEESHMSSSLKPALLDIHFSAKAGKLTCIAGRVGSGKTTLLRAILGELPISSNHGNNPSVELHGSVAYCPQSPWILNASVKENILFGHRYDAAFYDHTVKACQLLDDFDNLPDGDKTIVGEKGLSLSGGQKARVSLARAVYMRADIYILDDILSAVDSHVGKKLIKNVLSSEGVIADRTRILSTNSVPILSEADNIYYFKHGSILESGNLKAILDLDGDLATIIKDYSASSGVQVHADSQYPKDTEYSEEDDSEEVVSFDGTDITVHTALRIRRASSVSYNHVYEDNDAIITGDRDETAATGAVPFVKIWEYCKACGLYYFLAYIVLMAFTSLFSLTERYLLTKWSEKNMKSGKTEAPGLYLTGYISLGVSNGIFVLVSSYVLWSFCVINGSRYLHDSMTNAILRSPMSFFETTPVGRILNRFTHDMENVDDEIPWTVVNFLERVMRSLTTFAVMISVIPWNAFAILILLLVYNYYRVRYTATARQISRLQKIAKSPVLATIQESINGVDTISAFGQIGRFTYKCQHYINVLTTNTMTISSVTRWLSFRMQAIASVMILSTSLLATFSLKTENPMNAGLFGFTMTYVLVLTDTLYALLRAWSDVETETVSIERIAEYSELPLEAEMIIESNRPPKNWPTEGIVTFHNYSTKYRDGLDPVLKNLTISIKSKEKVGIVGRTGAGKSSLTLALFRIIEPCAGYIDIDGINTSEIGLFDLRSCLTIIPQESHVVNGTVRENLDPFGHFSDEKLYKVLEIAHLKEHVMQMRTTTSEEDTAPSITASGLDAILNEGGSNLSAGQRQLLSLARALLNENSKILVLDEATASVDVQTDKIIQEAIRREFKDKTILTIAHRLETVMDSDRILVLDNGEVKEFDSPDNLLKNASSEFSSLYKEGGYT